MIDEREVHQPPGGVRHVGCVDPAVLLLQRVCLHAMLGKDEHRADVSLVLRDGFARRSE